MAGDPPTRISPWRSLGVGCFFGFKVKGLGFRVKGLGFRISGLGFKFRV